MMIGDCVPLVVETQSGAPNVVDPGLLLLSVEVHTGYSVQLDHGPNGIADEGLLPSTSTIVTNKPSTVRSKQRDKPDDGFIPVWKKRNKRDQYKTNTNSKAIAEYSSSEHEDGEIVLGNQNGMKGGACPLKSMSSLLFWNCRGARKRSARFYLQKLVATHNITVIFLLETRVETVDRKDVDRLVGRDWNFTCVPSVGKSGGMLMLWRMGLIQASVIFSSQQIIWAKITVNNVCWNVGGVYANKDYIIRGRIWHDVSILLNDDVPTLLTGDFTCILGQGEKRGGKPFSSGAAVKDFADFIANQGWHDLRYVGTPFTWCNNKKDSGRILERLDRVFCNDSCISSKLYVRVSHLTRVASDHCPLLVTLDGQQCLAPRLPPKFEDYWLNSSGACAIARHTWNQPCSGSAADRLHKKCRKTMLALKNWNIKNIGAIDKKCLEVENRIREFQRIEGERQLDHSELTDLCKLVKEHELIANTIEMKWWQRAKVQWLQFGDRNSKFFHCMATHKSKATRMENFSDEQGNVIDNIDEITNMFVKHFSIRWCPEDIELDWEQLPQDLGRIPTNAAQDLISPVSDNEIVEAILSLGKNRAPGLDGITRSFFTGFWDFTGVDVLEAVHGFFSTGVMPTRWKETLVVLLPKQDQPTSPSHYRPIGLCKTIYKIVAKILVRRLKPLLGNLSSEEQGAFVEGRSIMDNCLLAQEAFYKMGHSEPASGAMAVKIDMEQAYDRVQWKFVDYMLKQMGFPDLWCR